MYTKTDLVSYLSKEKKLADIATTIPQKWGKWFLPKPVQKQFFYSQPPDFLIPPLACVKLSTSSR